jgi:GTP-binding protein
MTPMPTSKMGQYLRATFPSLDYLPIAFITAKSGKNVRAVLNLAQNLYKQASARVATADLNRVVRLALESNPPPMRQNRRAKVYYATQVAAAPPTIVLFVNRPELFDNTYHRYLIKTFRDHLPFKDVPIKLHLRRKRRGEAVPEEELDAPLATTESPGEHARKRKVDVKNLRFKTSVNDDDVKRGGYNDSDLWRDL